MKIVTPYACLMDVPDREAGIKLLKKIEWCGRISHRSEDAQTEDSWDRFIRAVVLGHGDWSIVEHASATVDMLVDRGITHELVRHRLFSYTQECVAGDTRLTANLTIKQAYDNNRIGAKIRSSDGSAISHNRIAHVFAKGRQPVFQVVTRGGYRLKSTMAHEFQNPDGTFSALRELGTGSAVMVNGRPSLLAINHKKAHSKFRIGVVPVVDHITSILFAGWEEVFDLEMQTYHNYVANGFIVHNSTRFVNYEKKMPAAFIIPPLDPAGVDPKYISEDTASRQIDWEYAIAQAEQAYRGLLKKGCTPQIARSVFPNALASRIIITGNLRNWRLFFLMRTTAEAHPQMRQVTHPLLTQFQERIPILFEDIKAGSRQVDNLRLPR